MQGTRNQFCENSCIGYIYIYIYAIMFLTFLTYLLSQTFNLLSGLLTIEIYTRNTAYPLSRISMIWYTIKDKNLSEKKRHMQMNSF
jgi:hypothetical protein